jgi:hypothetical protein
MVFDLSYDEAAERIPLQDLAAFQKTGTNLIGTQAFDAIVGLAHERGKRIDDVFKPLVCQIGVRYIAVLAATPVNHAVAVDELGFVFDPAEAAPSGQRWSEYDFYAVLGFF